MSCTHITEILPLYVGNDLDDAETERVTNHLLSCDPCRSLELQYRESSAWLKSVSTAGFERDSFPALQTRVSQRIKSDNRLRRSRTPYKVAAFLAAAATLLIASTLSMYLSASTKEQIPDVTIARSGVDVLPAEDPVKVVRRATHPRQRKLPIAKNPSLTFLPPTPVTTVTPVTSIVANTVRIEIQTADPRIRIIWLPSESGGDE